MEDNNLLVVPLHTQCWRDQTTNNACMAWTGGGMMVGWVLREGNESFCYRNNVHVFYVFFFFLDGLHQAYGTSYLIDYSDESYHV